MLPLVCCVSGFLPWWRLLPGRAVAGTLDDARLADLPLSAQEVKVHRWHGLFTGASYVQFKAEPEVIERWLSSSSALHKIEPKVLTPAQPRLPYGEEPERVDVERYVPDRMAPDWYNKTIRGHGRLFEIPPDSSGHNWGEVLVDDERNIVSIEVVWS